MGIQSKWSSFFPRCVVFKSRLVVTAFYLDTIESLGKLPANASMQHMRPLGLPQRHLPGLQPDRLRRHARTCRSCFCSVCVWGVCAVCGAEWCVSFVVGNISMLSLFFFVFHGWVRICVRLVVQKVVWDGIEQGTRGRGNCEMMMVVVVVE